MDLLGDRDRGTYSKSHKRKGVREELDAQKTRIKEHQSHKRQTEREELGVGHTCHEARCKCKLPGATKIAPGNF
ncbi:hypothetical protein XELAEV_18046887mg [Xenopus laevis]|uniref:Uncharacterized protein n=1 Tax=Xenopus laevis TaxID=8355 RepID=A0A974BU72_XENLA|nr:hypothetical protein XELAEV_18046887mg [Xenopus laevis]